MMGTKQAITFSTPYTSQWKAQAHHWNSFCIAKQQGGSRKFTKGVTPTQTSYQLNKRNYEHLNLSNRKWSTRVRQLQETRGRALWLGASAQLLCETIVNLFAL